eukprot:GAFH01000907.1.p3 GENE.GAFH01000907.1~~GAFH01000907.1.p3  ORF type:complete len:212 (+),score=53.24 GAFH01000907.1:1110-1745(+)
MACASRGARPGPRLPGPAKTHAFALVGCGTDVAVRDLETGDLVASHRFAEPIVSLQRRGDALFVGLRSGIDRLRLPHLKEPTTLMGRPGRGVLTAFHCDGKSLACVTSDGQLKVSQLAAPNPHSPGEAAVSDRSVCNVHVDAGRVVCLGEDYHMHMFNLQPRRAWALPGGSLQRADPVKPRPGSLTADGTWLLGVVWGKTLRIYDFSRARK